MCGLIVDTGSPLSLDAFRAAFATMAHRGPDSHVIDSLPGNVKIGFHRLAIMDTSHAGDQPFVDRERQLHAVCNGEIYNHRALREALLPYVRFSSGSDCEVLLPLYAREGIAGLVKKLDGEFAFVIVDQARGVCVAARDPLGIRPLFYGFESESGRTIFASEAKALHPICSEVYAFPPGCYYADEKFVRYCDPTVGSVHVRDEAAALTGIRDLLTDAVRKRLDADVPVGFLLSGGLDSSLVCAIAARESKKPLQTFAVGLRENPIDIKYARQVAEHIGSDHHEVYFEMDEVYAHLDDLIRQLETWDITTVRASIGMSLVCQYVRKQTGVRALLSGEVSDELFGYKYTDFAPTPQAFQDEAAKRIRELYMYDVLRADRCIALHSLEARVPFSDTDFVRFVMGIDPALKMNTHGMGKWLLRQAFAGTDLLPEAILWREKAAFSDAVGHGMVDQLKATAEARYSDGEFAQLRQQYRHGMPLSKEALMYREIFERHYPGRAALIADYWLPNQSWDNCKVSDPSARALPNYGLSGA